jgi:hypothetical protein
MLRDGQEGVLVEPGRPEELAGAIAALAGNPSHRRLLGEAGRLRYEAEFRQGMWVGRMLKVYESVLGRVAAPPDPRRAAAKDAPLPQPRNRMKRIASSLQGRGA